MAYDTIHNITAKTQRDEVVQPGGSAIEQKKTSYDAPTHLGERTYRYDADGNQLGWDNDKNGTRRNIVWDDENRIQSIFDNGHEKTYKYDDQGERIVKRGPQGETVYVNQWYTVRNREVASKHVYAGTTRIATSLVPGVKPVGFAPGNSPGNAKAVGQVNAGNAGIAVPLAAGESKLPTTAQQAPGIAKGTGLAHRSDQAAANSRNLEKNPHYATSGGDTGGTTAPGTATNQDNFLYYYHPDHLGSSSYVTDAYGKVFQHLEYFPFGETWVEESSNTQRTPYLFTASGDHMFMMKDAYVAKRNFDQVVASVKQNAEQCFTFTRTQVMTTGGMVTGGVRTDWNTSARGVSWSGGAHDPAPHGWRCAGEGAGRGAVPDGRGH